MRRVSGKNGDFPELLSFYPRKSSLPNEFAQFPNQKLPYCGAHGLSPFVKSMGLASRVFVGLGRFIQGSGGEKFLVKERCKHRDDRDTD